MHPFATIFTNINICPAPKISSEPTDPITRAMGGLEEGWGKGRAKLQKNMYSDTVNITKSNS